MSPINTVSEIEDNGRPPNVRVRKARRSLGKMHELFTEKLPDYRDPQTGLCNLHFLAKKLGMSYQGVYRWFAKNHKNHLPYAQAKRVVGLSELQKTGDHDFVPMTLEDIDPFITGR